MASLKRPAVRQSTEAIRINQWLDAWGERRHINKDGDGQPDGFFMFKLSARVLRLLSGVARRSSTGPRALDLAVQRAHDLSRSQEIVRYIHSGAMLAPTQVDKKATAKARRALRMPGWLPTSVIINILGPMDKRNRGRRASKKDLVEIKRAGTDEWSILLPESFVDAQDWEPEELHPIEVIDGQHRLLAFDDPTLPEDYELPIIAFYALDIKWQAYLFWSINIKPKRINPSLAFDLYPVMRNEEWLRLTEDIQVYRDTRAQEIVEALWSVPESPFYKRINMLGERGQNQVTQAAWIRSLTASFIKRWSAPNMIVGGLFGGERSDEPELPWTRSQQAAFIIYVFRSLFREIANQKPTWAKALDASGVLSKMRDGALEDDTLGVILSQHSLLRQDQAIRPLLHVFNDLLWLASDHLRLDRLFTMGSRRSSSMDVSAIKEALEEMDGTAAATFIDSISRTIACYDWRASTFPDLSDKERRHKQALRGSGGYKVLRLDLLQLLAKSSRSSRITESSKELIAALER